MVGDKGVKSLTRTALIAHGVVYLELGHRDALVVPLLDSNAVERLERALVVLLVLVDGEQQLEHVGAVGRCADDVLGKAGGRCNIIVVEAYGQQGLLVGHIVWLQGCRLLYHGDTHRVVALWAVTLCKIEICLRRVRHDVAATREHDTCRISPPRRELGDSVEEVVLVAGSHCRGVDRESVVGMGRHSRKKPRGHHGDGHDTHSHSLAGGGKQGAKRHVLFKKMCHL